MLLTPSVRKNYRLLPIACVLTIIGIWVEKGMGTVVPGFIPTPIGEVTEYAPTLIEILITMGDWAMGYAHRHRADEGCHRHSARGSEVRKRTMVE